MRTAPVTLEVPSRSPMTEGGIVSRVWDTFFRNLRSLLVSLGQERFFEIANNTAVAANIEGLKFGSESVSFAHVEYLIQRVTTGTGAQELIQGGAFFCSYLPTSDSWSLTTTGSTGPHSAGITFSITAAGQVQYTSTNITGTHSISKLTYRVRTLAAKNSQYSEAGK